MHEIKAESAVARAYKDTAYQRFYGRAMDGASVSTRSAAAAFDQWTLQAHDPPPQNPTPHRINFDDMSGLAPETPVTETPPSPTAHLPPTHRAPTEPTVHRAATPTGPTPPGAPTGAIIQYTGAPQAPKCHGTTTTTISLSTNLPNYESLRTIPTGSADKQHNGAFAVHHTRPTATQPQPILGTRPYGPNNNQPTPLPGTDTDTLPSTGVRTYQQASRVSPHRARLATTGHTTPVPRPPAPPISTHGLPHPPKRNAPGTIRQPILPTNRQDAP